MSWSLAVLATLEVVSFQSLALLLSLSSFHSSFYLSNSFIDQFAYTVIELIEAGYNVVVLDNLVNSKVESINRVKKIVGGKDIPFEKADLKDAAAVDKVFQKYHVSLLIFTRANNIP